jgi:hypothetical protein
LTKEGLHLDLGQWNIQEEHGGQNKEYYHPQFREPIPISQMSCFYIIYDIWLGFLLNLYEIVKKLEFILPR